MAIVAVSRSLADTQALAAGLAPFLGAGDAVCLRGDLGAGKTTFVAALVRALGGTAEVLSPTFTLENRYATPQGEVVHQDLYRFDGEADPDLASSLEEARDDGALALVEWGEPLVDRLAPYLDLRIALTGEGDPPARRFELTPVPKDWPHAAALTRRWRAEVSA